MIIAAGQTVPKGNDIAANMDDHCRLAELAARKGARLIIFPELSISGYELEKAEALSFKRDDERLEPLQLMAANNNIIIVAGAPLRLETGLHIGAFVFFPDGHTEVYTKQFLHAGEELFYAPSFSYDPQIRLEGEIISLAICADITNPLHAANAAGKGSTLYLAGIFYTPGGMEQGYGYLRKYANDHALKVLMANYGGPCYGLEAGGGSAFWDSNGDLKTSCSNQGEALLLVIKKGVEWNARVLQTNVGR